MYKPIIKLGIGLIVIYLALNAAVYYLTDLLIFLPSSSTYKTLPNLKTLTTKNGKKISAVYLQNPAAKYVLIYSHGNNEDLGVVMYTLHALYNMGFSVLSYDYEGYGTSEGTPSESATYQDIQAAYDYLINDKKMPAQRIILFGRSVGTGPTTELAAKYPVGGVILVSPFLSAYRVVTHYPLLLFDKFNNFANINKIKAPILFIHGKQDEIVPFWHGEMLFNEFNGTKVNCWLDDNGHNDLYIGRGKIRSCIQGFTQQL